MSAKTYRLKPHHLELLYSFILNGENGIRTNVNADYPDYLPYSNDPEDKYSSKFVDVLVNFLKEVTNNREAFLKVVSEIDDICLLNCNRREPGCESERCENIQKIDKMFGLKPGEKEYTVFDVIKKMEERVLIRCENSPKNS